MRTSIALGVLFVLATAPRIARANTYDVRPGDDLGARLSSLVAGDEVIVHAGTYPTGYVAVTWTGTSAMPIVVRAADGEARPVIQGTPAQNVINVAGSYFTFRGFAITGGSHGVRLGNTDHATLEDLVVHDIADVGISCNLPSNVCDSVTVRRCEIFATGGTGEGMYLGCNDAACTFRNSIVELNYIHDTRASSQGDGIEIKTGSYGNVVRDNVMVRTNYPGITLYGFASGAPNVIERNVVWDTLDNGIQIVGQVIVRNNVVIDAGASGIASKASQGFVPHDAVIVHNTVFHAGDACLRVNDWGAATTGSVIANNALYCEGTTAVRVPNGLGAAVIVANIGRGASDSASGFTLGRDAVMDLGNPAMAAVYPPAGSPLIDAGDPAHGASDDYNGTPRSDGMPDVGAYERTGATNPGWTIVEGFRGAPGSVGPSGDAGVDSGSTGDGGTASSSSGNGCSCRTTGNASSRGALPCLLLLALACAQRRRRSLQSRTIAEPQPSYSPSKGSSTSRIS